ncbi:MAG: biphenyl 2,3-dioxygenase [Gammaproteobacteria bacterium]|nr:biphenyl 2,3-dioxygenase [Gammaproteobacteria bacterium]MDH5728169.1 biphenyl 2,3-dioxygenase [Gammaproteobacteria bacterium]
MKHALFQSTLFCLSLLTLTLISSTSLAKGDLSAQEIKTVRVELSNKNDQLIFSPNLITIETGKLIKLVLSNPSNNKHYFSSDKLSQAVFTRKIQTLDERGSVISEIKGNIREVEVYPGRTVEWWLVPIKTGRYDDLKCVIPGHAEAGMVGRIEIF